MLFRSLFPSDAVTAVAPQQLDHEYYKARLHGSILNVVSEMPRRELVDTPAFNAVISGDRIDARRPAGRPFEFRCRAAHVFAVNPPLPSTAEMARGFWRRFLILSFNRSFERDPAARDKGMLLKELKSELAGIAFWAIEGAKRLQQQARFTALPSSDAELSQWRESADQVALFIRQGCKRLDPEVPDELAAMLGTEELYSSYRHWAERTGHRFSMTLNRFAERLDLLGYHLVKDGGQLVRPLKTADKKIDTVRQVPQPGFGWS